MEGSQFDKKITQITQIYWKLLKVKFEDLRIFQKIQENQNPELALWNYEGYDGYMKVFHWSFTINFHLL